MAFSNSFELSGTVSREPARTGKGPWKWSIVRGGGQKKGSDERWPLEFFDCLAWPDKVTGDSPAETIHKGSAVTLRGRLKCESWKDKESGKDRSRVVLDVLEIDIELEAKTREARPVPKQPVEDKSFEINDESIPF